MSTPKLPQKQGSNDNLDKTIHRPPDRQTSSKSLENAKNNVEIASETLNTRPNVRFPPKRPEEQPPPLPSQDDGQRYKISRPTLESKFSSLRGISRPGDSRKSLAKIPSDKTLQEMEDVVMEKRVEKPLERQSSALDRASLERSMGLERPLGERPMERTESDHVISRPQPRVAADALLPPLSTLSSQEQEARIVNDLLYIFLGCDANYIRPNRPEDPTKRLTLCQDEEGNAWEVDATMEPSLLSLVKMILPLGASYRYIHQTLEQLKVRQVNAGKALNAFGYSVRTILREYLALISQLDAQFRKNNLSLQKLWYHLTPTLRSIRCLQDTVRAVKHSVQSTKEARADIVGLLENRTIQCAGDPLARNLNLVLLRDCLPPLLDMLRQWIHQGILQDDQGIPEFFIVELFKESSRSAVREAFADKIWERFDIASDRVPPMFEQVKDKILNTGKYWGVIRKCRERDGHVGMESSNLQVQATTVPSEVMRAVGASQLLDEIESSYLTANRTLLNMLLNDYKLVDQLRTMKRYFLLDSSDFLTQFMDLSLPELLKRKDNVNLRRLQYLWDLCTGGKAEVEIQLSSRTFLEQLMKIIQIQGLENSRPVLPQDLPRDEVGMIYGVDALSLTMYPTFPTALIINSKAILKYQLVFRHVFYCKYVEMRLSKAWLLQTKRKHFGQNDMFWNKISILGIHMLELVRHVLFYMGCEVVEPRWKEMETRLLAASTVDQVLSVHNNFLDTCLKECMLSDDEVISTFSKLLQIAVKYVEFVEWLEEALVRGDDLKDLQFALPDFLTKKPQRSLQQTLQTLYDVFESEVKTLVEKLRQLGNTETSKLLSLATRMDFGGWYLDSR